VIEGLCEEGGRILLRASGVAGKHWKPLSEVVLKGLGNGGNPVEGSRTEC